ncbi:MAG: response regulator [Terriglobia bacterium]
MSRPSCLKFRTVLLIEDEPDLILTLTDLLEGEGYSVESIQDGKQALEVACMADCDVIVLDVMLP